MRRGKKEFHAEEEEEETKETAADTLLAPPGGPDNCRALQLLLLSRYFTEGTHVRAYNLRKPLIMG